MDMSTVFRCLLNTSRIWIIDWICRANGIGLRCIEYRTEDLEVGKQLLDRGANVNARDHTGWTPLYMAATDGQLETTRMLLEHGAAINTLIDGGYTPLHAASTEGHVEVVRLLLECGADPNACARDGSTPSDLASDRGWGKLVELLSEYGAKSVKAVAPSL